jgi:hypothetical protein
LAGYSVTFSVVDQASKQIEAINKRIEQMRAPMERQARAVQKFVDLSGLGKIADGFKAIARTALDAFSSMIRIVPVLGALTSAASIAGIAKLVEIWGQFGLTLQRDADRIGTSAQSLQQLQDMVRLAGGSADDMTESLKELTDAAAAAFSGRDPQTYAWFQRAGIALTDINGKLRSTTDILPEVIRYLDTLKNPADRMTAALGLGGQALFKLTEDMERAKRPGESLADTWKRLNAEAAKQAPLTDAQIAAQQRYAEATGALTVSFEHLEQQIGTTLATALTPFINQLAEFVRTHEPQITAAVNRLVTAFADWIKGIDWAKVEAGIEKIGGALQSLIDNLDTVKTVLEGIAIFMATKWILSFTTAFAQGIIAIGQLTGALGSVGAISAGSAITGVGLLGTLGAVAGVLLLIEETWRHWPDLVNAAKESLGALESGAARVGGNFGDWWRGRRTNAPTPAPSGPAGPPRPSGEATPFYGGVNDPLALIMGPESGGKNLAPGTSSTPEGTPTTASGFYQFLESTWREQAGKLGIDLAKYPTAYSAPANVQKAVAAQLYNEKGFQPWTTDPRSPIPGMIAARGGKEAFPQYIDPQQFLRPGGAGAAPTGGGTVTTKETPAGVNPELHAAMEKAFTNVLPPGYSARVTSGVREEAGSQHALGQAEDWQIYDPSGQPIRNRGADISGYYRKAAVEGLAQLQISDPELAKKFAWGGHFGTALGGGGEADLMHYDIGGVRGRIGDPYGERADAAARARELMAPQAEGKPVQVTGGPPVSGSVDVTVTHRNPPPGVTVAAKGAGDVNVAPPRIEQQQLAAA